jgi:chromosome segregation ATPase
MVSAGLLRVNKIMNENRDKIRGKVYGPLIELFDVEPGYETCVEVAAGNRYAKEVELNDVC